MTGSQHLKNYVIKINLLVSIIEILQVLAMEMSKAYSNVAPDIMNDIFENKKILYNLNNNCHFIPQNIKSVYHGSKRCR